MATNFTYPSNISAPFELFTRYPNEVTGGLFGIFVLLLIFIVSMISMHRFDSIKSPFAASSFITMIMAILFRTLSIIPDWALFLSIFMTIAGLAGLLFSRE